MKIVAKVLLVSGILLLLAGIAWELAVQARAVRATDLPLVMVMVGVFDLLAAWTLRPRRR